MQVELHPFEQTQVTALFQIQAQWSFVTTQSPKPRIKLKSTLSGPVDQLVFDQSASPSATDNLWQKTCFEFFGQKKDSAEYLEWNFSPGGDFQRYFFNDYRDQITSASAPTLDSLTIKWSKATSFLQVEIEVDLEYEIEKLQICWVIQTLEQSTSYWAIKHSSPKPDFHNSKAFLPVAQCATHK
jgi:hypothetical protein